MMAEDELSTLQHLAYSRNTQKKLAFKYNGNIIQYLGDTLIVLFDSKPDAVSFCVEAHRLFNLNCGIKSGYIYYVDGDVFGITINTASRLSEDVATNGCIMDGD